MVTSLTRSIAIVHISTSRAPVANHSARTTADRHITVSISRLRTTIISVDINQRSGDRWKLRVNCRGSPVWALWECRDRYWSRVSESKGIRTLIQQWQSCTLRTCGLLWQQAPGLLVVEERPSAFASSPQAFQPYLGWFSSVSLDRANSPLLLLLLLPAPERQQASFDANRHTLRNTVWERIREWAWE